MNKEDTKSRVMVLVQGETPDGQICDENMTGELIMTFAVQPNGVRIHSFGSMTGGMALGLIHALETAIEDIKEDFPQVTLYEALNTALEGLVKLKDTEEDEDE